VSAGTNTIPKPLKDRVKLQNEIKRTRELRTNCSRTKQATMERIRTLENERVDAYTRAARGNRNGKKDAERIEQEINAARRSIESADAEIAGAVRAEEQATAELDQLHTRELTTFVEVAEQDTQEAIASYEAVEQPYRKAYDAWNKSAGSWSPLRSAVYTMFKLQNEQAGYYLPERELMRAANVGPWPFPHPDELFPMPRVPRPAAFEPQAPSAEPVDDEEDDE
jgi:hypothetical protein